MRYEGLPGLKPVREDAMLTQAELAKLVGVTLTQINRIETGARNAGLKTQRKLCEVLSCTRDQLLHGARPTAQEVN